MRRFVSFVVLTVLAAGCSYVKSSRHLDFRPFAEYTISLAADIEYGISQQRAYYLRDFRRDPEIKRHEDLWKGVRMILKGVVAYSVEVTTLGSSTLSGPERCDKLAEFLDNMSRPVLTKYPMVFNVTSADLDTLLTDIRAQQKLLDGLSQAQPWVDELARVADVVFDNVNDSLDELAQYLVTRIDSMNIETVLYQQLIRDFQSQTFKAMMILGEHRHGDPSALARLLETDPQLRELIDSDDKLTLKEIQAIEARLIYKQKLAREFKEQIAPDLDLYRKQQEELDILYTSAKRHLRKARITVIVWSRAHRNLADGIVDPAKINIFDLTKKAIDTAL